jgi:hypothetical protein
VRLGTCVALELAVMASALGALWFGVGYAVRLAGDHVGAREASAAGLGATIRIPSIAVPQLVRLPGATLELAPAPEPTTSVFGASDETLLAPLGATAVVRVKPNKGGTSLSLRLDFESGATAVFKPEQIHPQSNPRREIAAFRMDRLLGIGRVQPAKAIRFAHEALVGAADPQWRTYTTNRINNEAIVRKGEIRGVVSWWIPEVRDLKIGAFKADEPEGRRIWESYLQIGAQVPTELQPVIEQLSTLVVFDVLIDNADRWSGANTKASPDGTTLYFMDNTLSFSRFKNGHETNLAPLRKIQVFPRALVGKLRALTLDTVKAAIDVGNDEGLAPLLDDVELRAILSRRNHMLAHIDALIEEHGEDAVLALP